MKDRETRQKNRREKRTDEKLTLNTKLVLVIAGSLLLAVGLFFVWLKTTVYIIDKRYLDETATARRTEEKIDRFSDYVRDNKVKSTDMNAILRWQQEEGSVYLLVYQNENVIYDSTKQKRRTVMERFFNKISNGNQKGRKLAESEEDKKKMLKNSWIQLQNMKICSRLVLMMLRPLQPSMAVMHFILCGSRMVCMTFVSWITQRKAFTISG